MCCGLPTWILKLVRLRSAFLQKGIQKHQNACFGDVVLTATCLLQVRGVWNHCCAASRL